ncbi:uncharacterized protein (DUF1800 family) [Pontibacter aydingkolensis]|uniref:DUF1800 domain-containing protein n=1 Tax=Pontibacter aydingkolensis TaxID=1911536 RepID=A0ABS7CX74_9BACT|nr:DUF1800 domain-containing protein [Pontibacter aydingkolensis]MBW7468390.1 DUF1800 domain-containing protein [Pontibacter aydingkolensis]
MTITLDTLKTQHLQWRAGFGPMPGQDLPSRIPQAVKQLLKESKQLQPLPAPDLNLQNINNLQGEARAAAAKMQREALQDLNCQWLNQMSTSKAQLREKMTLFWHGHFACRLRYPGVVQVQNNTLRKYALSPFPELLTAISKDPGMLQFLNNQQNRKQRPNENFARELLELFTLGRGHYTENDIREAARAFTGWGYNVQGEFVFRARQHDTGSKTFMGKTGNFNGDDILQILIENPRTAIFITQKIYTFFVSEKVNEDHVNELSKWFYSSGYNMEGLLEKVFTADWFYTSEVMGSHIKSPVELLVGMQRMFGLEYTDKRAPLVLQRVLGQVLFQPPNVSGWAGGLTWIDSSSLAFRLRMGQALLQDAALEVALKPDDDSEPSKPVQRRADGLRVVQARADFQKFIQEMVKVPEHKLAEEMSLFLLQVPLQKQKLAILQQSIVGKTSREEKITTLALHLVSLPEYQLS